MPTRTITLKIWDSLNSEESEAEELALEWYEHVGEIGEQSIALRCVVEKFVEKRWSDNDYPEQTEISVRTPDGRLLELVVLAEQTVDFRARPKKEDRG